MKIQMQKVCAFAALAASITLPAAAQTANISGTWKLDIAKSFMGNEHSANDYQLTKVFEQKSGAIKLTDIAAHGSTMNIPVPDSTTDMDLVADGEEHEVKLPAMYPGMPASVAKVSVVWQGNTLLVKETSQGFLGLSKTLRRYFLSEDGSKLIELVEGHTGFGDMEQRLVFNRQL